MLDRNRTKANIATIQEIASRYDRVALVLQGGGALGAYQAGVYQALSDAGCEPTWLSGVSIGAINASIIAGNEPSRRLQRLEQFWQTISGRKIWAYTPEGDIYRDIRNRTSSWMTMTMGQPGFFKPRFPNPWLEQSGAEGATSFYDTAELKETLERLIDRTYRLTAGDSFMFQSELPHAYNNPGETAARVLWVNTPPTF